MSLMPSGEFGGELVVAPPMTIKMIEMLARRINRERTKNSLKLLTDRERRILQLLSRGESNKCHLNTSISYDP